MSIYNGVSLAVLYKGVTVAEHVLVAYKLDGTAELILNDVYIRRLLTDDNNINL